MKKVLLAVLIVATGCTKETTVKPKKAIMETPPSTDCRKWPKGCPVGTAD